MESVIILTFTFNIVVTNTFEYLIMQLHTSYIEYDIVETHCYILIPMGGGGGGGGGGGANALDCERGDVAAGRIDVLATEVHQLKE